MLPPNLKDEIEDVELRLSLLTFRLRKLFSSSLNFGKPSMLDNMRLYGAFFTNLLEKGMVRKKETVHATPRAKPRMRNGNNFSNRQPLKEASVESSLILIR